jgi:hypothetical protein
MKILPKSPMPNAVYNVVTRSHARRRDVERSVRRKAMAER